MRLFLLVPVDLFLKSGQFGDSCAGSTWFNLAQLWLNAWCRNHGCVGTSFSQLQTCFKWQVSCFVTRLVIGFCFSLLILDLWLKFHCFQISNGRFKPMYHGGFASYKVCMRIKTATCWWRATSKSLDWWPPVAYRDFSFLYPWHRCPDFAYGSEWLHR